MLLLLVGVFPVFGLSANPDIIVVGIIGGCIGLFVLFIVGIMCWACCCYSGEIENISRAPLEDVTSIYPKNTSAHFVTLGEQLELLQAQKLVGTPAGAVAAQPQPTYQPPPPMAFMKPQNESAAAYWQNAYAGAYGAGQPVGGIIQGQEIQQAGYGGYATYQHGAVVPPAVEIPEVIPEPGKESSSDSSSV